MFTSFFFLSGSTTVSYGWMRSTCPRFPTVRPWKPSKRRALSSGCTCAEDDPFWRLSWKSNCSKGLKVIKPWMIDNRIPMTNHLAEVYAITHLRCTPFFYPPTFSVYQEIWNPAVVVVTEGKGNQSSKYEPKEGKDRFM